MVVMPLPYINLKQCHSCGVMKPRDAFAILPSGNRSNVCMLCRRRQKREWEHRTECEKEQKKQQRHMKHCPACGQDKPEEAFLPGFSHCRECQRKRRNGDA